MRISWVWNMINDHYGERKKARKHEKWGMKQDSIAWKFRTQNLVTTYTMTLRINLEYLLESLLDMLYIFSKLGKLEVQYFKWCANQSWNEEVMAIWRQLCKVEGPFRNSTYNLKSNLWIWYPIWNDPNFEFTYCHFDVLPPRPWKLYIGHSICPKWTPHD